MNNLNGLEEEWAGKLSRHFSGCQYDSQRTQRSEFMFIFHSMSALQVLNSASLPFKLTHLDVMLALQVIVYLFSTPNSPSITVNELIQKCFNYPLLCSVNILWFDIVSSSSSQISWHRRNIPKSKHSVLKKWTAQAAFFLQLIITINICFNWLGNSRRCCVPGFSTSSLKLEKKRDGDGWWQEQLSSVNGTYTQRERETR